MPGRPRALSAPKPCVNFDLEPTIIMDSKPKPNTQANPFYLNHTAPKPLPVKLLKAPKPSEPRVAPKIDRELCRIARIVLTNEDITIKAVSFPPTAGTYIDGVGDIIPTILLTATHPVSGWKWQFAVSKLYYLLIASGYPQFEFPVERAKHQKKGQEEGLRYFQSCWLYMARPPKVPLETG